MLECVHMKPDTIVEIRKRWGRWHYGPSLPKATVLATRDWLAYVQAMAQAMPPEEKTITFPTEKDVLWAWPDGVCVLFEEPLAVKHTIVSHETWDGSIEYDEPHLEEQIARGFVVGALTWTSPIDGTQHDAGLPLRPILWVGEDPADVITAYWLPDTMMHAQVEYGLSPSTRLGLSIITALGHRLTALSEPVGSRGERRRAERELPGLRLLKLASSASSPKAEGEHHVEWSKRWMVRGHWRLQPYGPRRELRRPTWIDPYIKGPPDAPFDARPTVWKT